MQNHQTVKEVVDNYFSEREKRMAYIDRLKQERSSDHKLIFTVVAIVSTLLWLFLWVLQK